MMTTRRITPIEIDKEEFRKIGHKLIDQIAEFIDSVGERRVTPGESPGQLQKLLGRAALPENGSSPADIVSRATKLLMNHSLFNGHPKFMGYITSSPAPIGAFADMLAAAVNPNVGAHILSPIATEIERQTVRWLAEFIGVTPDYGGILVSGGNMANFTAFVAARTAKGFKAIKSDGLAHNGEKLVVYCSSTTHIWVEKAANLFGLGTKSVRWIKTDANHKMDNAILESTIEKDLESGFKPIMVIGTAGDVSTGAVDNLEAIGVICKKFDLWFHIDGAYGIPAAAIPKLKNLFAGIGMADSIALDPHKWLYSPLEAGCTLVKNSQHLVDTFSAHPEYYNFSADHDEATLNYYEYGLQNSRGFRALKVWMALQQVGRSGYEKMIQEDIEVSDFFYQQAQRHPELEAVTHNLSITTLRYVPGNYSDHQNGEAYLNRLNETLLNNLQRGGEVFLSNAIVGEKYCLRGCIVNFRTSEKDIREIVEIIVKEGRRIHQGLSK